MSEPDPEYVHALDQLGAFLRDLPPLIANYYTGLVEEGVPPERALYLTTQLQASLFKADGIDREH